MDAKSGNGSSGNFIWGVVAGAIAILAAGGLYLSGVFTTASDEAVPQQDQTAALSEAENASAEESAEPIDKTEEPDQSADAAPAQTGGQATGAETESEAAPQSEPEQALSEPGEQTQVTPPELDQIFLSTDGTALLSGEAEPGSQVQVILNGAQLHEFDVDETGQFAEFVTIPFNDDAQGLVLQTTDGEQTAQSDDYLIAALPEPAEEQAPNADTENSSDTELADRPDQTAALDDDTQTETNAEPDTEEATPRQNDQGQQVAVLRSGEDGVELVQPPSTETKVPEQVELDTIGYSDTGDVQLTGRVKDGSAVRLYLDNQLVADLSPGDDGNWRGELEGIDPGVYTLRVDEVNTDGTVLSRVETPFKREPVEVLQAVEAAETGEASDETAPIRSVTVQQGDTLWAISRDRFGDGILYVRLFEANKNLIRDPDLIYPGQIFTVPE